MDLFPADRASTQFITEESEQSVRARPYDEAEYDQWVFEICRVDPTARRIMPSLALMNAFLASMKLSSLPSTPREVDQEEGGHRAGEDAQAALAVLHEMADAATDGEE